MTAIVLPTQDPLPPVPDAAAVADSPMLPIDDATDDAPTVRIDNGEDEAPRPGSGPVRLIALIFALAACWLARDLLVPVMLAMALALLCNPMVSRLARIWIPRWLGALVVVLGGLTVAIALSSLLVSPATDWVKQAPREMRQLAPKLKKITRQVEQANKAAESIVSAAGAAPTPNAAAAAQVDKPRPPNLWTLISGAPRMLASLLAIVLLGYFFLVFGDGLQRQAIARLEGSHRKQVMIGILRTIETDLSRYVLTISFINIALGLLLTGGLYLLGLDLADALLWGTVATVLNFIPYVGPLIGVILLAVVGVVAFDKPAEMFVPPALYLALHALESQFVTPIILGRRMSISPLVVLLWLMLWGFLWSIPGLLLAVPMLVTLKIIFERIEGLQGWAKVIE